MSEFKKFNSKPKEIEAIQYWPGVQFIGLYFKHEHTIEDLDGSRTLKSSPFVVTLHGQETFIASGDWIIKEPDGIHHYPCKPEVFQRSYEAVQ